VPLPEETYDELKHESSRAHRPATTLAREAISHWLEERRRTRIAVDIETYARDHANTDADLDADLEKATLTHLRNQTPWGRLRGSGELLGPPEQSVLEQQDFEALR
jgi:predicted DNA-binding protein